MIGGDQGTWTNFESGPDLARGLGKTFSKTNRVKKMPKFHRRRSPIAPRIPGSWFGLVLLVASLGCQKSPENAVLQPEATVVLNPREQPAAPSPGGKNANQPASRSEEASSTVAPQGENSLPSGSPGEIILAGKYRMTVPSNWVPRRPAVTLIEYEFTVPAAEGDTRDGRVTFMAAGGSVEANIERWINQFTQPDGRPSSERTKRETLEVGGLRVHLVDITGTYQESTGPMMGNPVARENYRMLGAVIESREGLHYFIKFYGPEKTVAANADAFRKMVESCRE